VAIADTDRKPGRWQVERTPIADAGQPENADRLQDCDERR
jgi:hypothetical protein